MLQKLKYAMLGVALLVAFAGGYSIAKTKGNLEIERLKKENAQTVINAQIQAKETYEKQIENLVAARASERERYAERLCQLEKFRSANTDLATCRRERSDLARLAVRGEGLLKRAESYLEALK